MLVYHLLDDVTGRLLPICGADLILSDDGDAGSRQLHRPQEVNIDDLIRTGEKFVREGKIV